MKRILLRLTALALAAIGTAIWIHSFYAIGRLPAGDGTGMQWVAEVPLSFIFFISTCPALILAIRGRQLALAAILGGFGAVALAVVWGRIAAEIAAR